MPRDESRDSNLLSNEPYDNGARVSVPLWLFRLVLGILLISLTTGVGVSLTRISDLELGQMEMKVKIDAIDDKIDASSTKLVRMEDYLIRALQGAYHSPFVDPLPTPPQTSKK